MYFKIIILAFAVTTVGSRPQFPLFQPEYQRRQNTFVQFSLDEIIDEFAKTVTNQFNADRRFTPKINNRQQHTNQKHDFHQQINETTSATIYESPKTNTVANHTTLFTNKPLPILNSTLAPQVKTANERRDNTHPYRQNNQENTVNISTDRSSNVEPVLDKADTPVLPVSSQDELEGRTGDDGTKTDDDRWVWGPADVTEKEVTMTTPDVDDRASFDGDVCPKGQVKIMNTCVDNH